MPDYSETIIYKITCNDPTVTSIYVGHTVDFRSRIRRHKSSCNNEKSKEYNYFIYQTIRDNGGWENWEIIEIEKYPCETMGDALSREGYWYKQLNGTLNKQVPSRTHKEYNTQYRQDNKEQITEKAKEQMKCECGACFRKDSKAKHLKTKKHLNFISNIF